MSVPPTSRTIDKMLRQRNQLVQVNFELSDIKSGLENKAARILLDFNEKVHRMTFSLNYLDLRKALCLKEFAWRIHQDDDQSTRNIKVGLTTHTKCQKSHILHAVSCCQHTLPSLFHCLLLAYRSIYTGRAETCICNPFQIALVGCVEDVGGLMETKGCISDGPQKADYSTPDETSGSTIMLD